MKKIGLVIIIQNQASVQPCLELLKIIQNIADNYYTLLVYNDNLDIPCINDSHVFNSKIVYKYRLDPLSMPLNCIISQLKISYHILNCFSNIDSWIFFMGETFIIPISLLKLLRKKSILCLSGSIEKDVTLRVPSLSKLIILNGKIGLKLSDYIIVYSKRLISEWNLGEYNQKIFVGSRHYVNFEDFNINRELSKRSNLIGYIGRLSPEKGSMNFAESVKILKKENLKFVFIGDGKLRTSIEQYIIENDLHSHLEYLGWVPHNNLPSYLNNLKLLVIPSYTEGLPNIMLEAMACGTPVLATPVGAIPEVIKDGKTGFIMENNSPECISKNIFRALEHPQLENIVQNAKEFIIENYTYEAALERYTNIFSDIEKGKLVSANH